MNCYGRSVKTAYILWKAPLKDFYLVLICTEALLYLTKFKGMESFNLWKKSFSNTNTRRQKEPEKQISPSTALVLSAVPGSTGLCTGHGSAAGVPPTALWSQQKFPFCIGRSWSGIPGLYTEQCSGSEWLVWVFNEIFISADTLHYHWNYSCQWTPMTVNSFGFLRTFTALGRRI